jgi:hypothetical protein
VWCGVVWGGVGQHLLTSTHESVLALDRQTEERTQSLTQRVSALTQSCTATSASANEWEQRLQHRLQQFAAQQEVYVTRMLEQQHTALQQHVQQQQREGLERVKAVSESVARLQAVVEGVQQKMEAGSAQRYVRLVWCGVTSL